jgi:hypothetical protein
MKMAGATGALGAAFAIGRNAAGEKDVAVWVPGSRDDEPENRGDGDEQRVLPPTPHLSTVQPGTQHAQGNGPREEVR